MFHQIGSDSGLFPEVVDRAELLLAPSDRADVVVDFSHFAVGDEVVMRNTGPDEPYGFQPAKPADPHTTGQVMKFKIVPLRDPDTSVLPTKLAAEQRLDSSQAVRSRHLTLEQAQDAQGRPILLLDGRTWTDPITETARLGDIEIWEVENFTPTSHPIHLHGARFQLLDRTNRETGIVPLQPFELGWEDTITVDPRERIRLIVPFDQITGTFVWHCHILEHEDREMMRPLRVIPVPEPAAFLLSLVACLLLTVPERGKLPL